MRNAKCAGTQNSMEWLYSSFLGCDKIYRIFSAAILELSFYKLRLQELFLTYPCSEMVRTNRKKRNFCGNQHVGLTPSKVM